MWCIPQVDGEYVAGVEDVLDLYAEAPDPKRPVVCFDESPTQLIGEVRQPIPAEPGQIERYDCEYKRNGTANLFVFLDAHRSWRKVKVTDSRAAVDFAACMRSAARRFSAFNFWPLLCFRLREDKRPEEAVREKEKVRRRR